MAELLDAAAVEAAVQRLPGWRGDPSALHRAVDLESFPAAIDLVGRIAEQAEQMNHHPDIDIRYRTVRLTLATHSAGGVTARDVELAERIERLLPG
jgi:4a-hydroxytetrahydrobiopterin dehydratase